MFLALANTTIFISRAGAIPFLWSKKSGALEAKNTWKIITVLKQLVLILQILFMLYQSYSFARAKDTRLFERIHVFYTTLGICIVAYNVIVVYKDPGAMQALMNNLIRTSHRFYGNPFPNMELIAATS